MGRYGLPRMFGWSGGMAAAHLPLGTGMNAANFQMRWLKKITE